MLSRYTNTHKPYWPNKLGPKDLLHGINNNPIFLRETAGNPERAR